MPLRVLPRPAAGAYSLGRPPAVDEECGPGLVVGLSGHNDSWLLMAGCGARAEQYQRTSTLRAEDWEPFLGSRGKWKEVLEDIERQALGAREAIKRMARIKSLGTDGLSAEFYSTYSTKLVPIWKSYTKPLVAGRLPDTTKHASDLAIKTWKK
ncbi:hypothetical protein NDU88_003889 [Pleurodeles waltl]|uniref:Uncharacterized protein n=1 Tax=Pleurodeles waltl TaxID=8319 RepID=A0AAV7SH73_PLEWA|nr:hypothetical protein NDU88_003889 [Pleurodeles waltl]